MVVNETFWVGVSFVMFVVLVFRPVKDFIVKHLDIRAEKIKSNLEEAARLKMEAEEMLVLYQQRKKDAAEEAEQIIQHAEQEALRVRKEAEEHLELALNKRIEMAMGRIAAYEARVVKEVQEYAIDCMMQSVKALVVSHLGVAQKEALVTQAISHIKTTVR